MKGTTVAIMLTVFAAIGGYGDESAKEDAGNRIRFSFADRQIVVLTVDNSAVRSLMATAEEAGHLRYSGRLRSVSRGSHALRSVGQSRIFLS